MTSDVLGDGVTVARPCCRANVRLRKPATGPPSPVDKPACSLLLLDVADARASRGRCHQPSARTTCHPTAWEEAGARRPRLLYQPRRARCATPWTRSATCRRSGRRERPASGAPSLARRERRRRGERTLAGWKPRRRNGARVPRRDVTAGTPVPLEMVAASRSRAAATPGRRCFDREHHVLVSEASPRKSRAARQRTLPPAHHCPRRARRGGDSARASGGSRGRASSEACSRSGPPPPPLLAARGGRGAGGDRASSSSPGGALLDSSSRPCAAAASQAVRGSVSRLEQRDDALDPGGSISSRRNVPHSATRRTGWPRHTRQFRVVVGRSGCSTRVTRRRSKRSAPETTARCERVPIHCMAAANTTRL